jgi:hypothetical protein
MGREINVNASDTLHLQDAADHAAALPMLIAAFDQRLSQVGGHAAILNAVVEIATKAGYKGTVEDAARLLKASGEFESGTTETGLVAVWRKS